MLLVDGRGCVWGDFNDVLLGCEKEGGQPKAPGCMDRFREALDDCSLMDLGFVGDPFTWRNNCHNSDNYIRECLDRAVADDAWCSRLSNFRVINGNPRHSDHRPIIVEVNEKMRSNVRPGGKAFRFEAGWIQEEHCKTIVENAWNLTMGVRAGSVVEAFREVGEDLLDWSRNVLGDLEKNIKLAKKNQEACRKLEINRRNIAREEILKYKLEKLEARRELYWRQRAQTHWLKNGDRNTKFYHAFASERRRRNRIKKLVRDDGGIVEDEQEIHNLITNFYKDLFCSCAGNRYDELLSQVEPRVTPLMN